jgi:hypothetical protein
MNATTSTRIPTTKVGEKSRSAIPAASGKPVLTLADKSDGVEASLIKNLRQRFRKV